jgi:hypothetical protein
MDLIRLSQHLAHLSRLPDIQQAQRDKLRKHGRDPTGQAIDIETRSQSMP